MNPLLEYAGMLERGELIASLKVIKMYRKLAREVQSGIGEYVFDPARAVKPIQFIERFCRQSKGEWIGRPVELELFQKAYICALFGFVHRTTGERRFKETMFLVARKNGKSTMLSAIALYMLVADGEGGAECYSVATKKDQAKIVFNESVNMLRQSPALSRHVKKRQHDMYFPMTFGRYEALSSDSNSLDGLNSHAVIIDELHAIKDRQLYEVMKQSMSARRQPLLLMITTAGTVRESIYDDMYEYASRVVEGEVTDERFLPVLYELDDRAEWTDYKCWMKANPALGSIKKVDDLTEKVERAKTNVNDLSGVLTKDFNVRDTVSGMWLSFEDVNHEARFTIDEVRDCYAVGGADLSSTIDLTCATLLIMRPDGMKYAVQQYFLPGDTIDRRIKEDRIPYDKWASRGFLTLCEGNKVNYSDVTAWFNRMYLEYGIRPLWVGYDTWNSQYWVEEMRAYGYSMEVVRQGAQSLSQPMKEMGADLAGKRINYNNNPILKWCLTNTSVKRDENDNIRPVKGQHSRQRIDGTVSLLIAYTVLFQKMEDYKSLM